MWQENNYPLMEVYAFLARDGANEGGRSNCGSYLVNDGLESITNLKLKIYALDLKYA